jgi:imidazolonepropionase-like amidohydrolase
MTVPVAMKSDHPGIDSRYVLHEAVLAHHYGLNATLALRSVTTTPAELLGKQHRVGFLKVGHDAGAWTRARGRLRKGSERNAH